MNHVFVFVYWIEGNPNTFFGGECDISRNFSFEEALEQAEKYFRDKHEINFKYEVFESFEIITEKAFEENYTLSQRYNMLWNYIENER